MARRMIAILLGALALAAGCYVLGRTTAGTDGARDAGYRQGHLDGYLAGVHDGTAEGMAAGRAEQEVAALPADARAAARRAFQDGYAAGANDAFAGYDGGWGLGAPYVITLQPGSGGITYRIATRTPLQPGTAYYLCPDGRSLCQGRR